MEGSPNCFSRVEKKEGTFSCWVVYVVSLRNSFVDKKKKMLFLRGAYRPVFILVKK